MIKFAWFTFTIGMTISALVISTLPSLGYAPATDEIVRPMPRPIMECWTVEGGLNCRVRK